VNKADTFDLDTKERPSAYVQWRHTDLCMDFFCECGAHCHFDGSGAFCVKCPRCETVWEMPSMLFPRKADERALETHRKNPKVMEDTGDIVDSQ